MVTNYQPTRKEKLRVLLFVFSIEKFTLKYGIGEYPPDNSLKKGVI